VFGRQFDPFGAPLADSFQVNTYTTSNQRIPAIGSNAAGDFVVVWRCHLLGPNAYTVYGQRYDSSGAAQGGEFAPHGYTTGTQGLFPSVAVGVDGDFVVVWEGEADSGQLDVWARRYDAGGVAQGSPFRLNQYTTGEQRDPEVVMDDDGNFIVIWSALGQDGSGRGIFGRVFDGSGVPLGGEFAVNSYTTGDQQNPSVTAGPNNRFAVVWQSLDQDGSGQGIFGQRFVLDPIFADGFESGSLAAWSSANTDGGDLAVSALAAMGLSSLGVRGLVDDTAGLFVQDDTPEDEDRYRARFYFDPNGFDPGEGQAHRRTRIFLAFEDGPRRLAAVVLRRLSGAYSLSVRARQDDNSQADTPFIAITDAPHVVEIDWHRASGPDAEDGSLELWIDGVSVATLTGLDNSISSVDFVRLGALSVKVGAGGTMYWDEFESRRATYIGP
jgi:hypothetical protein